MFCFLKDYADVKKLVQKHQAFMSELAGHEPRISRTISECEKLFAAQSSADLIRQPLSRLLEADWTALKNRSEERRQELDRALNEANYFSEASEADVWMQDKEQLIGENLNVFGKDENAAESMLKKHLVLMVDVEAFGEGTVYGDLM